MALHPDGAVLFLPKTREQIAYIERRISKEQVVLKFRYNLAASSKNSHVYKI